MHLPLIRTVEDLVDLTNDIGLLPFFENAIEGFSVEENITEDNWWHGSEEGRVDWPAWEWKGEVLRNKQLVYGKFTGGRACFVSLKWWPYLCNYRRDGYDFDSRCDELSAPQSDITAMKYLDKNGPCLSKTLKYGGAAFAKKGRTSYDQTVTRLQMQTYITPVDYVYPVSSKTGKEYGWGIARYDIADDYWGRRSCRGRYREEPEESYEKLLAQLKKKLPGVDEKKIRRLLQI